MEMYGKIRCVTYPELVSQGKILSVPNYKKKVREGRLRVVRAGRGAGSYALIDYNSLPDPVRQAYDAMYPNAQQEMKEELMSDSIRPDSGAVTFYKSYEPRITMERQADYVLNAEVMNEMFRVEKDMEALHKKCGYTRKSVVWETVLGTCEKLRTLYGHTLPANPVRLREKYNAYKRMGYAALINRNTGNQVARKISPDAARLLLKLRRSIVPRYTDMQILEEYNRQAAQCGLPLIKSITTVKSYLYDPAVMPMWYSAVYGMQKWKEKFTSKLKTRLPQMRDALWYSDGTKLNLYFRDERGKMCTTSVYEVMDAYSEVFLGYDVAPHETFDSQYRAYRMAIEVAGVRPYEVVTDNQGGHSKLAAQGFFQKICRLHKPTMPYNGQSKTIESAFGRFQQQILHKLWFFTGQNVTATKPGSKPNIEFIEQNAYALPTLQEVKEIYRRCREEWNNAAHPATGMARMEMYRMSENPATAAVTEADKVQMFWLKNPKPVTYTSYGLQMELNKQKYHYDVYGEDGLRNEAWALRNTGRAFHVLYDPMDMTHVELWEPTASGLKYSAMATPKVDISRATQERTPEDTSFMRRTIALGKEMMALTQLDGEQFDLDEAIAAELFGLSTPRPKNVSRQQMDEVRRKYERNELQAPVSLADKQKRDEDEADMSLHYSTTGEYTKAVSNLTLDELDFLDRY